MQQGLRLTSAWPLDHSTAWPLKWFAKCNLQSVFKNKNLTHTLLNGYIFSKLCITKWFRFFERKAVYMRRIMRKHWPNINIIQYKVMLCINNYSLNTFSYPNYRLLWNTCYQFWCTFLLFVILMYAAHLVWDQLLVSFWCCKTKYHADGY